MPSCRLLVLIAALLTAACGSLPRPFEHDAPNPLLDDHRAMAPLVVLSVEGVPGLAEETAKALQDDEEMTASTAMGGSGALVLRGGVERDRLMWRATDVYGKQIIEIGQPRPAANLDKPGRQAVAHQAAALVAMALRGEDSGVADLAARPHATLRPVQAPPPLSGDGLTREMSRALTLRGVVIDDHDPVAVIEGKLRISPGTSGEDLLEIAWTVRDAAGKELGVVSQGSPVDHTLLIGDLGQLGRDIVNAGADGVAEVVHKRSSSR